MNSTPRFPREKEFIEENPTKLKSPTKEDRTDLEIEFEEAEEDESRTARKEMADFILNGDGLGEEDEDKEPVEYRLPSEYNGPPKDSEKQALKKKRSFYGSEIYEENDEQVSYLRIKRHIE